MTRLAITSVAALLAMATSAWADDIYDRCSAARNSGDTETVAQLAETLERFTTHPAARERTAELCVTAAKGYRVHLDLASGKFLNDEEYEALLEKRQRESTATKVAAQDLRELEATIREHKDAARMTVMRRTVDACRELYSRDWVVAMTSDVCQPIFMELGLPD